MAKPTKKDKDQPPKKPLVPSRSLEVLSANVVTLMKHRQMTAPRVAARAKELKAKLDQKTVWRTVNRTNEPSLDKLDSLAAALQIEPWQLLFDGLNPEDLPIALSRETARSFAGIVRGVSAPDTENPEGTTTTDPVEQAQAVPKDRKKTPPKFEGSLLDSEGAENDARSSHGRAPRPKGRRSA